MDDRGWMFGRMKKSAQTEKSFMLKADDSDESALGELEKLLDRRIREAEAGHLSRRTAREIFAREIRNHF